MSHNPRSKKLSPDLLWGLWCAFVRFEDHGRKDDLLHLELYSDGSGGIIDSDDSGDPVTVAAWSTLAEATDVIASVGVTVNAGARLTGEGQ